MLGHCPIREHLQVEQNPQLIVGLIAPAELDGSIEGLFTSSSRVSSLVSESEWVTYQLAINRVITVEV